MFNRCLMIRLGIIMITLVIFSCSGASPLLDKNWGRSYEVSIYDQLVNPDAEKNLDPVLGLDGNAANNNVNKYRQSFKKTDQKEIVNILKLQ